MSESAPLKGRALAQVAIVVKDIEAAKQRWAAVLGVEPPNTIVTQPGDEVRMSFRGAPSNAQTKLAFFDLGGVQLELIEPMGGQSTWQEGLERGEGVHHLAFWVEDLPGVTAALGAHGVTQIQRGDMGEGQYAYYDADKPLGVTVELLERKRAD